MTLHAIASESSCTCNTRFNHSTCQIAGSNMWLERPNVNKRSSKSSPKNHLYEHLQIFLKEIIKFYKCIMLVLKERKQKIIQLIHSK